MDYIYESLFDKIEVLFNNLTCTVFSWNTEY